VGFEPTIPAFERAKTLHALDRAAAVIGALDIVAYLLLARAVEPQKQPLPSNGNLRLNNYYKVYILC
jgi:hypothetical protein